MYKRSLKGFTTLTISIMTCKEYLSLINATKSKLKNLRNLQTRKLKN